MSTSHRSFPMATITGALVSCWRRSFVHTILAGTCCLVTASMAPAAMVPEGSIGPLSYATDAAFDAAFRHTRGGGGLTITTVNDITGLYHSAKRAESKVWDSVNAANDEDISVFPLVAGQPLRMYTDFRLNVLDGNNQPRTDADLKVPLALVSPDGTRSYTGSIYSDPFSSHGWTATTAKVSLRLEDYNFISLADHPIYDRTSLLFNNQATTVTIDHTKWYRFEMVVERQTDAPNSALVTLSLYELAGGIQGGELGALLQSVQTTRLDLAGDGLGDSVQFGTLAAVTNARIWMDNFGLEIVPEPATAALLFGGGVLMTLRRR